jgi:hypothetical protein
MTLAAPLLVETLRAVAARRDIKADSIVTSNAGFRPGKDRSN